MRSGAAAIARLSRNGRTTSCRDTSKSPARRGVKEPHATLARASARLLGGPPVYSRLLVELLAKHVSACGGEHRWPWADGSVADEVASPEPGRAALAGELDRVPTMRHEVFGLDVPKSVPGVASEVMNPRATWSDPAAYDAQARKLAEMFVKNFEQFSEHVDQAVRAAGPKL